VLTGDDVLDMERQEVGVAFMQATILATATCTFPNEGAQRGIHQLGRQFAMSWRAFDFRIAINVAYET
jgi:hypothetical protein